jgi:predicted  nucleic acid-binding Zn-ribbon protein
MKTAQLPPVRVEASVREEIEAALHEGESLSEFVEMAAVQAARRRKSQEEFLARGRASLAKAKRTGEFYVADKVLEDMRGRLLSRMQALRKNKSTAVAKR